MELILTPFCRYILRQSKPWFFDTQNREFNFSVINKLNIQGASNHRCDIDRTMARRLGYFLKNNTGHFSWFCLICVRSEMQFLQLELLKAQERRRSAVVPSPAINTTQGGRGQAETLADHNATTGGRGQAAARPDRSTTAGGRGQGAVLTRAGGRGHEAAQIDPSNVSNRRGHKSGVEALGSEENSAPQKPSKQEVKTGEYMLNYLSTFRARTVQTWKGS